MLAVLVSHVWSRYVRRSTDAAEGFEPLKKTVEQAVERLEKTAEKFEDIARRVDGHGRRLDVHEQALREVRTTIKEQADEHDELRAADAALAERIKGAEVQLADLKDGLLRTHAKANEAHTAALQREVEAYRARRTRR